MGGTCRIQWVCLKYENERVLMQMNVCLQRGVFWLRTHIFLRQYTFIVGKCLHFERVYFLDNKNTQARVTPYHSRAVCAPRANKMKILPVFCSRIFMIRTATTEDIVVSKNKHALL